VPQQQPCQIGGDTQPTKVMPRDKPAHELRLGSVKATIWKNDTDKGVRFNTTLSRLYRDGDEWKSSESFGRDDLLLVAKVADRAHSWIHDQSKAETEENGARSSKK